MGKTNKRQASEFVNAIAKALTHFAFRNGPVEDMHAKGKLTQKDMKTLNKFMVNRMAYAIDLLFSDDTIDKFNSLVYFHDRNYGHEWDYAKLDDGDFEEIYERYYERLFEEVSATNDTKNDYSEKAVKSNPKDER